MQPTLVRGEGCSGLGFGEKLEGVSFWGVCVPGCEVPVKLMPASVVVPKKSVTRHPSLFLTCTNANISIGDHE